MKLNATLQLLVYADDVNILGRSVHTVEKNTEALAVACKGNGVEVNVDKTEHMSITRDQNAARSHSIKIDSSSFESMEEFRYLVTTLTYQNSIQEVIKTRLKSDNAFYHLVQNLLTSSCYQKMLRIRYTEL